MTFPYHMKEGVLYISPETTPGTPIAIATLAVGANAGIPIYDLTYTPDVKREVRTPDNYSTQSIPGVHGVKSAKIKFKTDVFTSGTAGTAPVLDPLFLACWFKKTVVASTSVTYTEDNTGMNGGSTRNTLTMAVGKRSNDGTKEILSLICGAAGSSWSMSGVVNSQQRLMIEWEFEGKIPSYAGVLTGRADTPSIPSSITYPDVTSDLVRFYGLTTTSGLWTRQINNFKFDRKIKASLTIDSSDLSGYGAMNWEAGDPTVTIDPYLVPVSVFDDLSQYLTGAIQTSAGFTTGATAGKIFTATWPNLQVAKIADKADGVNIRSEFELQATRTQTGIVADAFSLVFA